MTDLTTATPLEDMDEDEGRRLIELERKVEQAMASAGRIAGAALAEIRHKRLYRASHASFERYCLERHGLSKSAAQRMIAVATSDTNGLPPAVAAIGEASARAAQRRHETLDQPPVELDPDPEDLEDEPERPPVVPEPAEVTDVLRGVPDIPPMPTVAFPEAERQAQKEAQRGNREGAPPGVERSTRLRNRNDLNRILAVLDTADMVGMAKVSNPVERIRIANLHQAMADEERKQKINSSAQVDPKDCEHPANRRIGDMCGKCGATKKARA